MFLYFINFPKWDLVLISIVTKIHAYYWKIIDFNKMGGKVNIKCEQLNF